MVVGGSEGRDRIKEITFQWDHAPKCWGFPVSTEVANVDLEDEQECRRQRRHTRNIRRSRSERSSMGGMRHGQG